MDPLIWGPSTWKVMFAAAFHLPRECLIEVLRCLEHLLPCKHCRNSFALYMKHSPPELAITQGSGPSSRESAAMYVWYIKDKVNAKLGHRHLAFSDFVQRWQAFTIPFSDVEILQVLACIACQITLDSQIPQYIRFVKCMDRLLQNTHPTSVVTNLVSAPVAESCLSPPTIWYHSYSAVCKAMATSRPHTTAPQTPPSRDEFLARFRNKDVTPSSSDASRTKHQQRRPSSSRGHHSRQRH